MAPELNMLTFDTFVEFARTQDAAGKKKAIARADMDDLGRIVTRDIKPASGDWVGKVGRLDSLKRANNTTRDAFLKAVGDMFGGVTHIPNSVKDAMKLEDYGHGKPLTARRILAVKAAIENSGLAERKAFEASISKFQNQPAMEAKALGLGYAKGELPKLAKAVNLYVQVVGGSEEDAFAAVTTPGSKANRLMNYGGRFLQSKDDFKNGLRLLDSFGTWYDNTAAALDNMRSGLKINYQEGMSKTLLNGWYSVFVEDRKLPIERFVFEELAHNPDANLDETDPAKLFDLENNHAMSCIGRAFHHSCSQTFSQVPPEKRTTFFKALGFVSPLCATVEEREEVENDLRASIKGRQLAAPIARILKHLDELVLLDAQRKLTPASFTKLCFPEIPKPGAHPDQDIRDLVWQWDDDLVPPVPGDEDEVEQVGKYPKEYVTAMNEAMNATGCSIEDALLIAQGQKKLPNVPYYSTGTLALEDLDKPDAGRKQLSGDLIRPQNYTYKGQVDVLKQKNAGFTFNLPGDEPIVTNGSEEGKKNIPKVVQKLENLCGKVHPRQTSSLMMVMSQSGLGILRDGLLPFGVKSSEHSAVDFTVSKNDETGDITVRYSSPKELPFAFEWTATVDINGSITTSPMSFADKLDFAQAIKNVTTFKREPEDVKERVTNLLLENIGQEPDLMDLLRMNNGNVAYGIILDGVGDVRSNEEILEKLGALRQNVEELRAVTKGDRRTFELGLKQLTMMEGDALQPGNITKIYETVAKVDIGDIKKLNLSKNSSPKDIFNALCQMNNLVQKACSESKAMTTSKSEAKAAASTSVMLNSLISSFLLARCDKQTVEGIRDAFYSENGQQMLLALQKIGMNEYPPGVQVPREDTASHSHVAGTLETYFYDLTAVANQTLGTKDFDMPGASPTIEPESFQAITDRFLDHAASMDDALKTRDGLMKGDLSGFGSADLEDLLKGAQ